MGDLRHYRKWADPSGDESGLAPGTVSAVEVLDHLRHFCSSPHHVFWTESVSLTDTALFNLAHIGGHRQITDVYLLGLAKRRGGTLVTLDDSIPLKAVIGATRRHLSILAEA